MPPKKKEGKKGKSGKKTATVQKETAVPPLTEENREFFLEQIQDLEKKVTRYQRLCDELTIKNGQFNEQFEQVSTDKKEIVSFLKKSLEQRGEEIADLQDRLIGLQQVKDTEKDSYEKQLQQVRTELQETKDQLTQENNILGGRLAALEEFKVQREEYYQRMANLEQRFVDQEEAHKEEIYKIERKQVVDKNRLKKDMLLRVNQVAAEFRKVSNKQMAETTKRTIRENVAINTQLSKMSDKTLELIEENDGLTSKSSIHKQHIELLEANEKELAKKNHSNQKIIAMLAEKCKSQEVTLSEYEMREEQYLELDQKADMFRQQVDAYKAEIETLVREIDEMESHVVHTKKDIGEERAVAQKLQTILAEAAAALQKTLQVVSSEDVLESAADLSEKRDSMLHRLLVLLNSAAVLGVGPLPADLGRTAPSRARTPGHIPGSGVGLRKSEVQQISVTKTAQPQPHYQPGDLGFIPKPTQHIFTNLEKMHGCNREKRLGTLKVSKRSIGVQTTSSAKAAFYADELMSHMGVSKDLRPVIKSPSLHSQKLTNKVF